ncbi:Got1/Sft2-like family-domain-containing protein [Aspergillus fruticulosus]
MASTSFRDSVNSLGWSRRDGDAPANTSSTPFLSRLQSFNPFGQGDGYLQLPTHEAPGAPLPAPSRREEEDTFFALSRWDRMLIFFACNLGAAVCFVICFFLFPVLSLKPRKFAILWSVGSLLFLLSWAVLMGPMIYARHLISGSRLPFTAAYFGSIAMTLYFAIGHLLHVHAAAIKKESCFTCQPALSPLLSVSASCFLNSNEMRIAQP